MLPRPTTVRRGLFCRNSGEKVRLDFQEIRVNLSLQLDGAGDGGCVVLRFFLSPTNTASIIPEQRLSGKHSIT